MRSRPVPSPCVCVCALDENDICIGCQRSSAEITRWSDMTDDERLEVMKLVAKREEKIAL
ncbi:DUF1289 domain-containing protein [Marinobacter fonticola]|uniref:DUF1289 domain-containing protein n=1 Tax=Marinobacter fonticola TaxID=2603215 RepID=UPI001D0DB6DF|nr:DUF1289 domain-containing protein [Marinobacter fonticola]